MKTTRPICVSLPNELLDRIDSVAAMEERSRSQIITRLVRGSILDHAPVRPHDPRRPIAGDQPRSPDER